MMVFVLYYVKQKVVIRMRKLIMIKLMIILLIISVHVWWCYYCLGREVWWKKW